MLFPVMLPFARNAPDSNTVWPALSRTLKYKNKPGRDLELLRDQLLLLMGHVERLRDADPPLHLTGSWDALRAGVEGAARKVDLRRAEDQVDAVVCAYVALLAERRPGDLTTYGDFETGYIVTPTLPDAYAVGSLSWTQALKPISRHVTSWSAKSAAPPARANTSCSDTWPK